MSDDCNHRRFSSIVTFRMNDKWRSHESDPAGTIHLSRLTEDVILRVMDAPSDLDELSRAKLLSAYFDELSRTPFDEMVMPAELKADLIAHAPTRLRQPVKTLQAEDAPQREAHEHLASVPAPPTPPAGAVFILGLLYPADKLPAVVGDLDEIFVDVVERHGVGLARLLYRAQVARAVLSFTWAAIERLLKIRELFGLFTGG